MFAMALKDDFGKYLELLFDDLRTKDNGLSQRNIEQITFQKVSTTYARFSTLKEISDQYYMVS